MKWFLSLWNCLVSLSGQDATPLKTSNLSWAPLKHFCFVRNFSLSDRAWLTNPVHHDVPLTPYILSVDLLSSFAPEDNLLVSAVMTNVTCVCFSFPDLSTPLGFLPPFLSPSKTIYPFLAMLLQGLKRTYKTYYLHGLFVKVEIGSWRQLQTYLTFKNLRITIE